MSKNKLIFSRAIFTLFIIIIFGIIIMNEKGGIIFSKKISTNINNYLDTNYNDISNNIKKGKTEYIKGQFITKVYSKENKNHFFYITYSKGKINDTYKKDYLEGNSILEYQNNIIKKTIKQTTDLDCNVNSIAKLNAFTEIVQKNIINGNNLTELKYYYIEYNINIDNWTTDNILKEITNNIKILEKNNITPKYQNITITSKNDITKSIKINNIQNSFINNGMKHEIINDIINNNNSILLKENKITYKVLNEEE